MANPKKQFALKGFILVLAYLIFGLIAFTTFLSQYYLPVFPLLLVFFYLVSVFSFNTIVSVTQNNSREFTNKFVMFSGIKLVLYLILIVLYLFYDRSNAVPFLTGFFVLYVSFSIYDVAYSVAYIKKQSRSEDPYKKRK